MNVSSTGMSSIKICFCLELFAHDHLHTIIRSTELFLMIFK